MQIKNREVVQQIEQPNKKINVDNSISSSDLEAHHDIFDKELQQEARAIALEKISPFPYTLFPEPIAKFIHATARALSCPPDFVGMGVLACASVAIGNGAILPLKTSWETGCTLYCGVVAEPGSAKTPAINKALKPLNDLQKRNFEEYQSKKMQYQLEREHYELEYEKWKQNIKSTKGTNAIEKPEEPKSPTPQQIITMDSTLEALYEILAANPKGIIKVHDELLGFVKGMNQYRSGSDRQFWLSAWSNESIQVNRKGKELLEILRPFISIIGGIQPEVIEEFIKEGREGNANDGFIDRFLFCYPDPVPSKWTNEDVSNEVVEEYCDVIFRLYYGLHVDKPTIINLDSKAKEVFITWYDVTEEETLATAFPETLKGIWRKLKGLHPRILLIVHLLKWSCNPGKVNIEVIDEETVIRTNYIMEYFKTHAKKLFQYSQANYKDINIIKLMDYVKRKGEKHERGISIRVNALNQGKVFGRKTNINLIEDTIHQIEGQGLGEVEHLSYKNNTFKQFVLYEKAF
ncbi:YfjI family protein [Bacillus altitudinis]|uniref:YfjI family protein n=1 Tax=Bacillus altitudinis TaxID=293387 RepID=UPI0031F68A5E